MHNSCSRNTFSVAAVRVHIKALQQFQNQYEEKKIINIKGVENSNLALSLQIHKLFCCLRVFVPVKAHLVWHTL